MLAWWPAKQRGENNVTNAVTETDETCENCDTEVLKVDPDDTTYACYICNPKAGCGRVIRYDEDDR